MKKSVILGFLIITGIAVLLVYAVGLDFNHESVEATLISSFKLSAAKVISTEIYFTGVVSGNKKAVNEQKAFVEKFAKQIGVLKNEGYLCRQINNNSIQKIEISGVTKENIAIDINLQLEDVSKENVMTVSITQYGTVEGLLEIKKEVSGVLKKYKVHPKVNSCITGSIAGKYENFQINELCDKILKGAEAEKIFTTRDRNLISVSAYSHILGSTLYVSGKKMNLNLAVRYNALEDKTYIWLATPVITKEY